MRFETFVRFLRLEVFSVLKERFKRLNEFNGFKRLEAFYVFDFLNLLILLSIFKFRILTLPSPLEEGFGKGASKSQSENGRESVK